MQLEHKPHGRQLLAGKQAVIQIGQLQVFDSGPDGDRGTADDDLFAVQGIFIP